MIARVIQPFSVVVVLVVSGCTAESPTTPSAAASPVSVTFASNLTPGGTVTRLFTAAGPGTVTLTLDSLAQPVTVGLSLGLTRADGAGCYGSTSVQATAGSLPQISIDVDAGNYCAAIYDVGTIVESVAFSITIAHP